MIIIIMSIKMMLMITANYFISKNINNMIYNINLKKLLRIHLNKL